MNTISYRTTRQVRVFTSSAGRRVIYTSDRDGHPQVYIADIPESLRV